MLQLPSFPDGGFRGGERRLRAAGIQGPDLASPWTIRWLAMITDSIAHWIEHLTSRLRVPGSIPGGDVLFEGKSNTRQP